MNLEGELVVTLARDAQAVRNVDVRLSRPRVASRILSGRTAADAATTIPLLYSVCGGAQGAAAACALAAAGAAGFVAESPSRTAGVIVEALQENFWHLLIGWPNAMSAEPQVTAVTAVRYLIATSTRASDGSDLLGDAKAMRELAARLAHLAEGAIYAMAPGAFLERVDVAALERWCAEAKTGPARLLRQVLVEAQVPRRNDVRLLPPLSRDRVRHVIAPALRDDPDFPRAPTWAGAPAETGALARMHEHPLVADCERRFGRTAATRIVARMVEVARLFAELADEQDAMPTLPRAQSVGLGDGDGLGVVETARGVLLHRARVHDECIVDYQIVAPTDWNFHPEGPLVHALTGANAGDDAALLRHARLAIHALDPCVACKVEVARA
ncbi:MAG: nickel-dependent hydrogenase large subunit [Burkholderiales bacterium]|nr:nickel-dependent hydrogenase large subunit [Burkholderiales bacterium]